MRVLAVLRPGRDSCQPAPLSAAGVVGQPSDAPAPSEMLEHTLPVGTWPSTSTPLRRHRPGVPIPYS